MQDMQNELYSIRIQNQMNNGEKDLLHLVDTIKLTADPCAMCQWWKQMNKKCMTTCTGVKDLCTLKYKFFKELPEKMMTHAETSYILFNCDTFNKYADFLSMIFNVKFIERGCRIKSISR